MEQRTVRKTYKYKLNPTAQQAWELGRVLDLCRALYNTALAQRLVAYQRRHVSVSRYQQEAPLKERRAAMPEYAASHSHVLPAVPARLDKTYQAFFRRVQRGEQAGFPRYQSRDRWHSFTDKDAYKEVGNVATLRKGFLIPSKFGRVGVRWSRPLARPRPSRSAGKRTAAMSASRARKRPCRPCRLLDGRRASTWGSRRSPPCPLARASFIPAGIARRSARSKPRNGGSRVARRAAHACALTRASARAVAQICARLDGLPLAIELVAARTKVLPPAALLTRLERSLPLLTGGARDLPARQQTMQDAIAWSYDQLPGNEKRLFWRIAVTSGGRTLEAAEAIANIEGDLDTLTSMEALVEVNMVSQEDGPGGEPRFRSLQIIREFAQERLKASSEEPALRERHAEFFLNFAEEAAPYLMSSARWEWIERLGADYWNFVAALEWTLANRPEWCLRLAGALGWFWFVRGYDADGRAWVERALAATDSSARTVERARALHWAAGLAFAQGDFAAAQEPDEQSVAIYRELGDQRGLAHGLHLSGAILGQRGGSEALPALEESVKLFRAAGDRWGLALATAGLGDGVMLTADLVRAHTLYEESLALYQEQGDIWGRATVLQSLALLVWTEGDLAAAGALYGESVQLARTLGDKWDLARALTSAAAIALQQSDLARASSKAAEALRLWRELGNRPGMALGALAGVAAVEEDARRAGRLFGVARATLAAGASYYLIGGVDVEAQIAAARAHLNTATFDAAMEAGKSQSLTKAVALALGEDESE
jgi:hypothetical protein